MVRVGMMTPNLTLDMLSDIIEAFQNEHVFKFAHLPVQSGDNQVLKRMNRLYSVEEFKLAIEAFRNAIPSVTVATDVICGFPSESDDAFERSLRLIKEIRPDVVNISKFFPRPNTAAEKMMQRVPPTEVNQRSREVTSLAARISFEKNREWLNWEGPVLIDEPGKQPNSFIGRNFAYKPIVVKNCDPTLLGTFQKVKVTEAFQTYLKAEILD
jgi:tRNA A37 methylthiotransferase MiaB